jgi:hypothetical protein
VSEYGALRMKAKRRVVFSIYRTIAKQEKKPLEVSKNRQRRPMGSPAFFYGIERSGIMVVAFNNNVDMLKNRWKMVLYRILPEKKT